MMSFFSSLPDLFMPRGSRPALRDQFLDSVHAATEAAPQNSDTAPENRILRTRSGGKVELRFAFEEYRWAMHKDQILISHMVSQTPGKGHGDEAMEFLKAEADNLGVNLTMFARPIAHEAMPMEHLGRWLQKHDFHLQGIPHDLYIREVGGVNPSPAAAP